MSLLFAFPQQAALAASYGAAAGLEQGAWEWRHFPDGESYVRILSDVHTKPVTLLCSLDHADEKTLALAFLARTLKELGAGTITLVAPYLGYMRQDKRFREGEAVTSTVFARLLADFIDGIVTIDPHLHRRKNLEELYACACTAVSAAPLMAAWIAAHVPNPLIVGPDKESEQWVRVVAGQAGAPHVILDKTRSGDRDVDIRLPDVGSYKGHTPVLVDDIISTGFTMIKTIDLLRQQGFGPITCLATHGIFADNAYEELLKTGLATIVTTNTIPHPSNAIDVTSLFLSRAL